MIAQKQKKRTPVFFAIAILLSFTMVLMQGVPAFASDEMQANQLVGKAQLTLQSFMCDPNMGAFRSLIRNAKGIMIVPSLLKGAFIVGASGGSGVLLVRNGSSDTFSGPAFYTLGGASFGLQIGGQSSEVILLAMTDRGVNAFLNSSFKLGGNVGLAVGPVGMGASAATANLSADIVSFSRSKGLYGGISLDGAVVAVRGSLNRAYYGGPVSPTGILLTHTARNRNSSLLTASVAQAASGMVARKECSELAQVGQAGSVALNQKLAQIQQ